MIKSTTEEYGNSTINKANALIDSEDYNMEVAGEELATCLMDTEISTYGVYEDLVNAYIDGDINFRMGMDRTLGLLIEMNLENLTEHIKNVIKERTDEHER